LNEDLTTVNSRLLLLLLLLVILLLLLLLLLVSCYCCSFSCVCSFSYFILSASNLHLWTGNLTVCY